MKKFIFFYLITPVLLWVLVFTNDYMRHSDIYFCIVLTIFILIIIFLTKGIIKLCEVKEQYLLLLPLWFIILLFGGALFFMFYDIIKYGALQ
jgi:hypothetical protein